MELKVLSLKGLEYKGEINSLNVKTTSGEITVLDHHRPLITILTKGTAVIIGKENQKTKLEISSGFLEVSPDNRISVLID